MADRCYTGGRVSGWERVAQETWLRAEKEPGFCSEKGRGGSPAPTSAGGVREQLPSIKLQLGIWHRENALYP